MILWATVGNSGKATQITVWCLHILSRWLVKQTFCISLRPQCYRFSSVVSISFLTVSHAIIHFVRSLHPLRDTFVIWNTCEGLWSGLKIADHTTHAFGWLWLWFFFTHCSSHCRRFSVGFFFHINVCSTCTI